ncbi:fimbrial protein [Dryocola clanedunensis]|uniref:fimbrial protein n=1 Tax=Cedecea sulfonylureivorans TaxID=3051154 RepID=UPI0019293AC6|nr:fimbrial protein [Cedecea sulfonylureivorans]
MKKLNTYMSALALCLASTSAFAALSDGQGIVTFNGELTDDTCVVADDSKDIQVTLPKISTKSLATAGSQAGSTLFDINVTDCPTTITKVAAHFEAIDATKFNAVTGNLINQDVSANTAGKTVEVRLYDADGTFLSVGKTGKSFDVDSTTNKAKLTYVGGYYATAPTSPGTVKAVVQYTLAYP